MNISRLQTDKIVVGTNDVSYVPPDISPTGTAVLNALFMLEKLVHRQDMFSFKYNIKHCTTEST